MSFDWSMSSESPSSTYYFRVLSLVSDDEEEEETAAVKPASSSQEISPDADPDAAPEGAKDDDDEEPTDPTVKSEKGKEKRHAKDEIPVYTYDELEGLNRDHLVGQVSLLEGKHGFATPELR